MRGARRYLISHPDITARKVAEEALEAMSVTDPLTGLANRRRLDTFLSNEWRRALRQLHILEQREHPFWANVNSDSDGT